MNTDKAYLLGLVVGGGSFSADHTIFNIKLPYKEWGDVKKNPERGGKIATDILKIVKPILETEYDLTVSYKSSSEWIINCTGNTQPLIDDLATFNISPSSNLRETADLSQLIAALADENMKKRFISGVADTIGSLNPTHRRFNENVQIISFEIKGFNYPYVCELCRLLYDLGCVPDQILWQHPNMQSGSDSYYKSWRKGNKLRVALDSFNTFGAISFKSKKIASDNNLKLEATGTSNQAIKCEVKQIKAPSITAVHIDEGSEKIPAKIRNGHYIHHKQFCAVLGCEHAPYKQLDNLLNNAQKYICPFTVLTKGSVTEIADIISKNPLLGGRTYTNINIPISFLTSGSFNNSRLINFDLSRIHTDSKGKILSQNDGWLYFDETKKKGYRLNIILDAVNYVVCASLNKLKGKRPLGIRKENLEFMLKKDPGFYVQFQIPDLLTPLIITNNIVSAMVGPLNADVYKTLISFDPVNKYKMYIRDIKESDLMKK